MLLRWTFSRENHVHINPHFKYFTPRNFCKRNFREVKNSWNLLDKHSQIGKATNFSEINFREWRNWYISRDKHKGLNISTKPIAKSFTSSNIFLGIFLHDPNDKILSIKKKIIEVYHAKYQMPDLTTYRNV